MLDMSHLFPPSMGSGAEPALSLPSDGLVRTAPPILAGQRLAMPRNRLLAALPEDELEQLRPRLEPVELSIRQKLQTPDMRPAHIVFPETASVSCRISLENGDTAEVAQVGREGVVGIATLFGQEQSGFEAVVEASGSALRLEARQLRHALEHLPRFRMLLQRYVLAYLEQVARTGACDGRHTITQRILRRILMTHDHIAGDEFPMTHEHLAMLLGVRRAGVTVAASALRQAGLIRYVRGRIQVVDRPGLERIACDCHGAIRRIHERVVQLPD